LYSILYFKDRGTKIKQVFDLNKRLINFFKIFLKKLIGVTYNC